MRKKEQEERPNLCKHPRLCSRLAANRRSDSIVGNADGGFWQERVCDKTGAWINCTGCDAFLFFFPTVLCESFHKSATLSLRSALFVTPRILLFTPNALSLNSTGGNENQHFVDGLALRGRALQVRFLFYWQREGERETDEWWFHHLAHCECEVTPGQHKSS